MIIKRNLYISDAVQFGRNFEPKQGCVLGEPGQIRGVDKFKGRLIIGDNVAIGANTVICIGKEGDTLIGDNVSIGNLTNIGHNVEIGEGSEIGAGVIISGHVKIGKNVKIKTGTLIRNRVNIADGITIGMGSNVVEDLKDEGFTYYGNPCEKILGTKTNEG